MPIEPSVSQISDLNDAYPDDEDAKAIGANHLRNIKTAVLSLTDGGGADQIGYKHTSSATARTAQDKLRELWISPEDKGAVGNGVADDTAALVAALAAGDVKLTPGANYRITSRITPPDGRYIKGDRSSIITMDSASFDITTQEDYDTASGAAFLMDSMTSGGLSGFRIRMSTYGAELCAGAVIVRSCSSPKVYVKGVEFDNFSNAKIIRVESSADVEIVENYFHDCEISSASTGQLTCIDVDDNRPDGPSFRVRVERNRVKDITCSADFLNSFGNQTDGINVSHYDSSYHSIQHNIIETVGDGIDCFGSDCTIAGNIIKDAYNNAIKIIHGACRNTVVGNSIRSPGQGGIVVVGSSTRHTEHHLIAHNTISDVNAAGNWTSDNNYGIRCDDNSGSFYSKNNVFIGNKIVNCDAMKYGILTTSNSTLNVFRDNHVQSYLVAEFHSETGTDDFKSITKSLVRVTTSGQSIPNSGFTKVVFDTESVDSNSEWDTSAHTYTPTTSRRLWVHCRIRTSAATAGKLWQVAIYNGGTELERAELYAAANGDLSVAVSAVVQLGPSDSLSFQASHNESGSVALTALTSYTAAHIAEI